MMSRGRREIGHIYIRCIEHKGYKMKDFFTNIYFKITHNTHQEMWDFISRGDESDPSP